MIQLTEKYRPKTREEFIGDKTLIDKLDNFIESYKPVILVGPSGVGKTTSAYIIARKYGYYVHELNSSDDRNSDTIESLRSCLTTQDLRPTLFLIDEVDGMTKSPINCQKKLGELLEDTTKPVILTANDEYSLDKKLISSCKVIRMSLHQKYLSEVVELIRKISKKEGIPVTFENVTTDIRSSINNTFYGGTKYKVEKNDFEKVNCIFRNGDMIDIDPIWLFDNVKNFYDGPNIHLAIKQIANYAKFKRKEIFSCLPKATSGYPRYPTYFKLFRKN